MARLDRWGVLPQLVMIAWIRDNYVVDAVPWEWMMTTTLAHFMRLELLRVFLAATVALLGLVAARAALSMARRRGTTAPSPPRAQATFATTVIGSTGALVAALAVISVIAGRPQPVSFERASTFFFPLLLLLGMAICGWAIERSPTVRERRFLTWLIPSIVLSGTIVLWDQTFDWSRRAVEVSNHGMRFLTGRHSLADAYSHQESGLPFGGINPRALAAWRQVEPGAAVWATNIDAYCMVPGCWMQSVVSFKMSGRLDEIVTGPPDRAKELLQEAGLNYFLISQDARLLDLLPYSKLFAPDTIGRYLGIKWTDGTAFLLTWSGPGITPLTPEFFNVYRELFARPEMSWFRFSTLASQIAPATAKLREKAWGAPAEFPWRRPPPDGTVNIVEATYGGNCQSFTPKFPATNYVARGNASGVLHDECSGKSRCVIPWEAQRIGDPASGCDKDFLVTYNCRPGTPVMTVRLMPEAAGQTITLNCPTP